MQLARQLGARDLIVHTDSQLVAKQINGEYDVKEVVLKKHHAMATQLLARFDKVEVKQLLRNFNTCGDALSKLAPSIIIE